MKKQHKRILYGLGFFAILVVLVACSSDPIIIGETKPEGLLDTLLVYPISWLINKVFELTANGGWAISLATIIINILISPLEIFSQVEQKKQQEVQPQIQALAEKYPENKTDKVQQQKYAIEMQRIYDDNGLSMMGMCVPMLLMLFIQMPILSAMFGAVRRLTILSQSSFTLFGINYVYGEIDPGIPYFPIEAVAPYLRLFIFAALIAIFASQIFSMPKGQRNPRKNQQAMQMYMMNGIMIFMFWNQPIALAIYWIVSNLTRLLFRYTITNRIVARQHEKYKIKKREEKAKRYK